MKLKDIARQLREVADRGGGFGSETEKSLREIADAFDLRPDYEAKDLVKALKPKASRAKKSSQFQVPADKLVGDYVEALLKHQGSAEGLPILGTILKDAAIKRPELFEIAGRFLGAQLTFKNRGEAAAAIKEKLTRRDWDQGALQIIRDRAKPKQA